MKQRVITAIIMIAVGLPILIYGKLPFIILGLLLALVATQEMIDMKETVAKTPIEVKLFTMLATLMIMFSSFNFKTLSFTGTLTFGLGTMALFLFILLLLVNCCIVYNYSNNFICQYSLYITGFLRPGFLLCKNTASTSLR